MALQWLGAPTAFRRFSILDQMQLPCSLEIRQAGIDLLSKRFSRSPRSTDIDSSTGDEISPEVQWYGLQTVLEQASSDALILLDCCAAASSATSNGNGVTEIIAACGFEAWAPGVGQHSFTRSLIDELRYLSRKGPFSSSLLHNKVLSRVKYWKPRYAPSATSNFREERRTPIYIVISNEVSPRSIELQPQHQRLSKASSSEAVSPVSRGSAFSSLSTSSDQTSTTETAIQSDSSLSDEVWPDKDFECPKILMSVALEEEQWLHPQQMNNWIRDIPALVKYVTVEGVWKGHSALILVSVPIAVWNLMPRNPAISFMGFSRSGNLLNMYPTQPEATPQEHEAGKAPGNYDVMDLNDKDKDISNLVPQLSGIKLDTQRAQKISQEQDRLEDNQTSSISDRHPAQTGIIEVAARDRTSMSSDKDTKRGSLRISQGVPIPPHYQWWCGYCRAGPMSVEYNFACLFCLRKKDHTAYTERAPAPRR